MSMQEKKRLKIRYITVTGMLSALSAVLMMISFSVPFMPSFIKLDFSEMPALIAAFRMGPLSGVTVCLIKNLINVCFTTTGGVGEFANFLLGCCLVVPAGLIYHYHKNRKMALIGSLVGALSMAAMSLPMNYFVTYPIYGKFLPLETIVGMYQAIVPSVDGLFWCLLLFNVPFTFLKGGLDAAITFLVYKNISPLIHGGKRKTGSVEENYAKFANEETKTKRTSEEISTEEEN